MQYWCIHRQVLRGDHLTFQIYTEEGAHAVVTTPGAGKWYRTNGKPAAQHIYLNARGRSILEWLPQEAMLYDGANAQSETTIHLDQAASFYWVGYAGSWASGSRGDIF